MKTILITLLALVAIKGTALSLAAEIVIPADQSKLRTSELPGYAIALQKCGICHSADYISYQPPGMTQAQWTDEMVKMRNSYGAPIDDKEIALIGAYLAVAYGSAKADDPSIVALSAVVEESVSQAKNADQPIDVQALLASNACLGCHGIDNAVVGPAFTAVAERYKSDGTADALAKSIKNGGSGKWGAVPMPPMPGLSETQVRALADFVLAQ